MNSTVAVFASISPAEPTLSPSHFIPFLNAIDGGCVRGCQVAGRYGSFGITNAQHRERINASAIGTRDGATHVIFTPLDFMARLAALVPKPRVSLTRHHGAMSIDLGVQQKAALAGDIRQVR